eukprot:8572140-Alexandrium_andersonii.AAC.1
MGIQPNTDLACAVAVLVAAVDRRTRPGGRSDRVQDGDDHAWGARLRVLSARLHEELDFLLAGCSLA